MAWNKLLPMLSYRAIIFLSTFYRFSIRPWRQRRHLNTLSLPPNSVKWRVGKYEKLHKDGPIGGSTSYCYIVISPFSSYSIRRRWITVKMVTAVNFYDPISSSSERTLIVIETSVVGDQTMMTFLVVKELQEWRMKTRLQLHGNQLQLLLRFWTIGCHHCHHYYVHTAAKASFSNM